MNFWNDITPKDWITFSIALASLALGVYNILRVIRVETPKVHVICEMGKGYATVSKESPMQIKILNIRPNPVTITRIGFIAEGKFIDIDFEFDSLAEKPPYFILGNGCKVIEYAPELARTFTFLHRLEGTFAITGSGRICKHLFHN